MNEIKVPHEYLDALQHIRELAAVRSWPMSRDVMDALIAAAEADQPPLPEGWVLLNTTRGWRALWHEDGDLYEHNMLGGGVWAKVAEIQRDRLIPLRPAVTEADVERAAVEASFSPSIVRRIADVLGIEVTP